MALNKESDSDGGSTIDSNNDKGDCELTLAEEMTIYTISNLKQELSKNMDSYQTLALNLQNVEEIDSAGIQLLLALDKELSQKNKSLKLTSMSGAVNKLIESYGLSDRFPIGEAA